MANQYEVIELDAVRHRIVESYEINLPDKVFKRFNEQPLGKLVVSVYLYVFDRNLHREYRWHRKFDRFGRLDIFHPLREGGRK